MSDEGGGTAGPDLTQGVATDALADGQMLLGHVGAQGVLLARRGSEFFAVGAACTHYHGPLADGLMVGETVRCPWHHACFSLRTGEALAAPALSPIDCWRTELRDGTVFVRERMEAKPAAHVAAAGPTLKTIVIVGGGAAGLAAAEMLRRRHYAGEIVMLSDDQAPPVDRPNLSKDYLAGNAPEDWLELRGSDFFEQQRIDLRLGTTVAGIDPGAREVMLGDGSTLAFDRLLLATGAEPVRLQIPGTDLPHVFTLRTLTDCRRIIERARVARRAVVMGASFIGLEVAASLRARGLEVHVVAPDKRPMERVLGPQVGDFVRRLHEQHGVIFHLEDVATEITAQGVALRHGASIEADLVVVGIGVRPRLALAEKAGLAVDRGVLVDRGLETSAPGIFAAGDIARWPDARSGTPIRVEHWVVAQRQGQTAARNMLGGREPFAVVPFFWSQHYDVPISYVGHAESWDEIVIDGDLDARDCVVQYVRGGRVLAMASVNRDVESLQAEVAMEREAVQPSMAA